jgi:hypothetical protein
MLVSKVRIESTTEEDDPDEKERDAHACSLAQSA